MARSFRFDYTKGMSAVVDPSMMGNGYAVMIDNADFTAYAAASYRAPVFRRTVPEGTSHVFEYRGKWWFSQEHRRWAAEFIGRQERLYYTESGHAPGAGKPAMKVIDGVEAHLGLPRPICPVQVSTSVPTVPTGFTVEAVSIEGSTGDPKSHTYRIGFRTKDGLLPPGEAITISLNNGAMARLHWAKPVLAGVTAVVVYGREMGKEQILDEVSPFDLEYLDTGGNAPRGEYASNLDEVDTFYYFHTFLRDVNGHVDESGPSPRSRMVSTSEARTITRTPSFEGILDPSTVKIGVNAFKTPTQLEMCGSVLRLSGRRVITTKTNHGLGMGDEIGVLPKHSAAMDEHTPKQVYKISTFLTDLPTPTITSFGAGSSGATAWTSGALLRVRVAAFRGAAWESCRGGVPAEGLPSDEAQWITTTAKARVEWALASDEADGFHVYLNDRWVATVPAGIFHLEFDTLTTVPDRPVPGTNLSRTRAFHLAEDPGMTWDAVLASEAPLGYGFIAKPVETRIAWERHGLSKGDLVTFSGYKELNGAYTVARVGGADEFYLHALTETDDLDATTRRCQKARPEYRFVNKWALYVQRGTAGGVPLQQGVYSIDETSVVDTKPVHSLSVTCDSAYYAQTTEGEVLVEFNPPPKGMRGLTLHNNSLWGIVDNDVVWTPINRPDAFPSACRRSFPVPPTALESYAGALIVLLPNGVGRFDGPDPFNPSFSMTAARDGCIAPNSVQRTAAGLMYLSPRGLMAFQAELNTSVPITEGKIEASLFHGASSSPTDVWPTWWITTRNSAAWAKCTRDLPSAEGWQMERLVDETLPMDGILEDIRSFYWRGKYYLYFTGPHFGRHGTLVVDTTRRSEGGYPVTHLGLRPRHAHVTDLDKLFVLLGDAAPLVTTVAITVPPGPYWHSYGPITYTATPATQGYQESDHTITWAFDDGTTATGKTVEKTWATPGPHTATAAARNLVTGTTGEGTKTLNLETRPVDITSDFSVDADGWTVLQDGTLEWNPEGFITCNDLHTGQITQMVAPSKYLGDRIDYYGGVMRWKLRPRSSVDFNGRPGILAILSGSEQISINLNLPIRDEWNQFEARLDTTADWRLGSYDNNDPVATEAQIKSILANVTSLRFCSEFTALVDSVDLKDAYWGMG